MIDGTLLIPFNYPIKCYNFENMFGMDKQKRQFNTNVLMIIPRKCI
jgi:hypothetical protein